MNPEDYPAKSYPYRSEGALDYLSTGWFAIGIVLSLVVFSLLVIGDIFSYIDKTLEKRRLDKIYNDNKK